VSYNSQMSVDSRMQHLSATRQLSTRRCRTSWKVSASLRSPTLRVVPSLALPLLLPLEYPLPVICRLRMQRRQLLQPPAAAMLRLLPQFRTGLCLITLVITNYPLVTLVDMLYRQFSLNNMLKLYAPRQAVRSSNMDELTVPHADTSSLFCSWTTSLESVTARAASMQYTFVL